jgi:hypothetical protein
MIHIAPSLFLWSYRIGERRLTVSLKKTKKEVLWFTSGHPDAFLEEDLS